MKLIQVNSGDDDGAPYVEKVVLHIEQTWPGLGTVDKRHDIMKRQMKESRGWHEGTLSRSMR